MIRSWPAIHTGDGPVSYSLEYNGMKLLSTDELLTGLKREAAGDPRRVKAKRPPEGALLGAVAATIKGR